MLRLQDHADQDGMVWGCVQTVGGQERLCAGEIARIGLSSYWPQYATSRRRNGCSKGTVPVVRSLFPGYVFAAWPLADAHAWRRIRAVRGQRRVLESAYDTPALLDPLFVRALICHESELAHNLGMVRNMLRMKPGDVIRITEGPFADLWAKLISLDSDGRIAVLIDILGRRTVVKGLSVDQVDVA